MIYLGADHNGFWLKEELKGYLKRRGASIKDMGAIKQRAGDDYPDYAAKVARSLKNPNDLGILVCGSGHGMVIAANKVKRARAVMPFSVFSAKKSREEDHANILVFSAWEMNIEKAKRITAAWLTAKPSKVFRHVRRLKKIKQLER